METVASIKRHRGFKYMYRNKWTKGWNVVYNAREQGLDPCGGKYTVVCLKHSFLVNSDRLSTLKNMDSINWCNPCQKIAIKRGYRF